LPALTVAVLGLGEAGSRLAADLTAAGAEVRGYDPQNGGVPEEAIAGSDVVLSVNSARDAVEAAESARAALGRKALFADLNTAAPALKREVAEVSYLRAVSWGVSAAAILRLTAITDVHFSNSAVVAAASAALSVALARMLGSTPSLHAPERPS